MHFLQLFAMIFKRDRMLSKYFKFFRSIFSKSFVPPNAPTISKRFVRKVSHFTPKSSSNLELPSFIPKKSAVTFAKYSRHTRRFATFKMRTFKMLKAQNLATFFYLNDRWRWITTILLISRKFFFFAGEFNNFSVRGKEDSRTFNLLWNWFALRTKRLRVRSVSFKLKR